jgi:hypothetical protein
MAIAAARGVDFGKQRGDVKEVVALKLGRNIFNPSLTSKQRASHRSGPNAVETGRKEMT